MLPIALVGCVACVACLDWWAVARGHHRLETYAKPLVMVMLIATTLTLDIEPMNVQLLVVAALALGLVGDVMLLPNVDNFLAGLGAFLVGHVLYVVAFVRLGVGGSALAIGASISVVVTLMLGAPIVRAVATSRVSRPVQLYIITIAVMVATGVGTGRWPVAVGAIVFALSDGLLGHDRFVTPRSDRRLWVHLMYHVGQTAIVLGL